MRILIIDNNIDPKCWGAGDLCRFARAVPGGTVHVRRAPHDDLPRDPALFDRIIVSGSKTSAMEDAPWIERLHAFVRSAINGNTPFLGVCYGHQTLARALGGKETVRRAAEPEFGWTRIEIVRESPLLSGLPRQFHSYSSHFDEVARLPSGMKLLARSELCAIQACQLENKPIFGIQFHPEKDAAGAKTSLAERKRLSSPKKLLNAGKTDELYDPKIGDTIFRNFLEL